MAVAVDSATRSLVSQVEETLNMARASVEALPRRHSSMYRVPVRIKDLNPMAYKPQVVSLGPFHHGDPELVPMERHKKRALRNLLQRAIPRLGEFVAAVEVVAEQLECAYDLDLGSEWCGVEGRRRFLEMMILDGCFLLEVMRASRIDGRRTSDYGPNDPIFSHHGYMVPYIRRDMLMLENQLPLLLLQKLVAVERLGTAMPPDDGEINMMVLRFMSPSSSLPETSRGLGLHPLDVRRRSMVYGQFQESRWDVGYVPERNIIRSAVELREVGIRFQKSNSDILDDIKFWHGVLHIPPVVADNSTEYMFLNMMAFERLHVGAGSDVTAFVFFMGSIIKSAKDVALLSTSGIIQNTVGSDEAVVKLFTSLSKDIVLMSDRKLDAVRRDVNDYCRKPWNMWRANIIHNYFRIPTSSLNFLAGVIALVMTWSNF
ncbi:unnamed protein product [Urochloa decumbens]|uniref:Uncharacterized protein n=1 Tax=Urochloa decumbens TaxID=240449 RepID=A0ABC9B1X5_9POAL